MGGNHGRYTPEYTQLWVQTVVYFGLAVWVYKEKLKTGTHVFISTGSKG